MTRASGGGDYAAARFSHFAVADWSGAVGARQKGIEIAICAEGTAAPVLVRPGHVWSRQDVLDWIVGDMPQDTLLGLDLSPALPFADAGSYFPGWPESPPDAPTLWAFVDGICRHDPHFSVSSFVDHPEASCYFRRHGGRTGDRFGIGRGRLRVVEQRQREQQLSPYSCFNLVGAAQVGKSSLSGMRVLHQLAQRVPVWPVDSVPDTGSVIVEIYTSLAARAAGIRSGFSKMRDAASLDAALAALGSAPHLPIAAYSDHATDAIMTAAWLRTVKADAALWNPSGLAEVGRTEGWTFGVR